MIAILLLFDHKPNNEHHVDPNKSTIDVQIQNPLRKNPIHRCQIFKFDKPCKTRSIICIANLIKVQHFEQISAPLISFSKFNKTKKGKTSKRTLPTTKSDVIIIRHVNIKHKFTFNWIELICRKHFMIFWLNSRKE